MPPSMVFITTMIKQKNHRDRQFKLKTDRKAITTSLLGLQTTATLTTALYHSLPQEQNMVTLPREKYKQRLEASMTGLPRPMLRGLISQDPYELQKHNVTRQHWKEIEAHVPHANLTMPLGSCPSIDLLWPQESFPNANPNPNPNPNRPPCLQLPGVENPNRTNHISRKGQSLSSSAWQGPRLQ